MIHRIVITLPLLVGLCSSIVGADPFLTGRVTDEEGRPIEGATVQMWDCIGTCFRAGARLTDKNGNYTFEKKSFRNLPMLSASMPGRYVADKSETGPGLNKPDTGEQRRINFVLGNPAALTLTLKGDVPEGWTQKVLLRAAKKKQAVYRYDLTGIENSGWGTWRFDEIPRNESYHVVAVRTPIPEPTDDPEEMKKRKQELWKRQVEIICAPVKFENPQRYSLTVNILDHDESKTVHMKIDSFTDVLGNSQIEESVADGRRFDPPVSAELQEQANALLKRVAKSASPWNARPPKSIAAYEYDSVGADGKTTHVKIDRDSPSGPAWSDISRLRGFAWMPSLRWLFSQPENVVFHSVEIADDKATLVYRLKSSRGFAAGLGVGPGWNGFFQRKFSTGTIIINTRTATVKEHRLCPGLTGEESVETFDNYARVGDGYAPRSLRIQSGGFDFRLSFQIHGDQLWLLDKATRDESDQPTLRTENVVVTMAEN